MADFLCIFTYGFLGLIFTEFDVATLNWARGMTYVWLFVSFGPCFLIFFNGSVETASGALFQKSEAFVSNFFLHVSKGDWGV